MIVIEKVGDQYKISINKIPMWLRFDSMQEVMDWLNSLKKSIDELNNA